MAKKVATAATVEEYMQGCTHPLRNVVEVLRTLIKDTDKEIGEQIKWNSPAFYYTGEMKPFDPKEYKRDIAIVNLNRQEYVLVVFPSGNHIPVSPVLQDENLKNGRKLVKITALDDDKKHALQALVGQWLALVEK